MSWYTEYKSSLKLKEVEEILDLFYFRPLAFLLVKAIYPTDIRPNHLTVASILMGIVAGCFFSLGTPAGITAGALFYMAFNIFDCSDGQLARLKKNGTPIGKILDGLGDLTATIAVYVGLAFGFANHQENPSLWWLLLVLTGLSNGIHGLLVDFYRNRFLDYYKLQKNNFEEEIEKFRIAHDLARAENKRFEQYVISFYLKYTNLQKVIAGKRKRLRMFNISPSEYYRKNRLIMRFWLLIGPTSQISTLIICALFHRIDLFPLIVLIGFNGLAIILLIIQKAIESTYKSVAA